MNGQFRASILARGKNRTFLRLFGQRVFKIDTISKVKQRDINIHLFSDEVRRENVYPTLIPNFDRTPRTNKDIVYYESTPSVFEESVRDCLGYLREKKEEQRIIILKSWNEWGEGNYMEPDIMYGRGYIEALSRCLK